jgi:hypothetical protein
VAATAEAKKKPSTEARYQLTTQYVLPVGNLFLASTLQESLATRAPTAPARQREERIDLDGRAGMRRSLALFVDRQAEAPRATRLRLALPGGEAARPVVFATSSFDPWRGPAPAEGRDKTARILGSERRFEERQGRFETATTGRAGFSVELGK